MIHNFCTITKLFILPVYPLPNVLSTMSNNPNSFCKYSLITSTSDLQSSTAISSISLGKSVSTNVNHIPYIGNNSRKKTFANFTDFGMIANLFLRIGQQGIYIALWGQTISSVINICDGRKTEKHSLDMRGYVQG